MKKRYVCKERRRCTVDLICWPVICIDEPATFRLNDSPAELSCFDRKTNKKNWRLAESRCVICEQSFIKISFCYHIYFVSYSHYVIIKYYGWSARLAWTRATDKLCFFINVEHVDTRPPMYMFPKSIELYKLIENNRLTIKIMKKKKILI